MKALIIYDSFFGNTEQVARSICTALGQQGAVSAIRVGEARPEQLAGLDLLIVGSPTRQFRPSPAIQAFLRTIPADQLKGVKVAAFDTRIAPEDIKQPVLRFFVSTMGYAAPRIAKQLAAKGGEPVKAPEGFVVVNSEGPLREGELERAAGWVKSLN